jgi:hypothetical protein
MRRNMCLLTGPTTLSSVYVTFEMLCYISITIRIHRLPYPIKEIIARPYTESRSEPYYPSSNQARAAFRMFHIASCSDSPYPTTCVHIQLSENACAEVHFDHKAYCRTSCGISVTQSEHICAIVPSGIYSRITGYYT